MKTLNFILSSVNSCNLSIRGIVVFILMLCFILSSQAQSPSYFDFETKLYNQGQPIVNRAINLIVELKADSSIWYSERHNNELTDAEGNVVIKVGQGTNPSDQWANINWNSSNDLSITIRGKFVGDNSSPTKVFAQNLALPIVTYAQSLVTPASIPVIKGKTTIEGKLIARGESVLDDLIVNGESTLNTLTVSGIATIGGISVFLDDTKVNEKLEVLGRGLFSSHITVDGNTTLNGDFRAKKKSSFSKTTRFHGESTFYSTIMARGTENKYYRSGRYANNRGGWKDHDAETRPVSLLARERVVTSRIVTYSDERVKNSFGPVTQLAAIENIKSIQPYEYLLKSDPGLIYRGFKAQELEKELPDAVDKIEGIAPTIYKMAKVKLLDDEKIELLLDSEVSLEPGAIVELIADDTYKVTVLNVKKNSFIVSRWASDIRDEVFVYGEQLSDLRAVDYNYIFTTNVVVTQALIDKAETLEGELLALKGQLSTITIEQDKILNLLERMQNEELETVSKDGTDN